ncbi:UV DNA damage repair endonuclease UvsE [Dethiothermospora halolimnae]|uniref:UV DNA damage repair endonuclease UvsE n=1 Tax=Dethiothermospora halolimnae TaxID=3114390 RepID=UPI003CCBC5D4
MKIRLGYVSMAIDLKDCSPSKTVSYTQYKKIDDKEVKLYKLNKITEENLTNIKRILLYNAAHDIKVYRITSKIVPLVTHPDVIDWDYITPFKKLYNNINKIIKDNNFRVSAHPDHFTIISSPREDVVKSSIKDLVYHNNIMDAMGLDTDCGKLVLHIGGKYKSKKKTLQRFEKAYNNLDDSLKNRLILENDDKTYNMIDVLTLCEKIKAPMVFDIHHHWCNNNDEDIENYLERIFSTWDDQKLIPKIHISSPKSDKKFRAHADNIDFESFYSFIKKAKSIDRDFDIMIEAKNKNMALFNLMKEIKNHNEFKVLDQASFEF